MPKYKKPFLLHDPLRLNERFYESYDEFFLYRKVAIFEMLLNDPDLFAKFDADGDDSERERRRHAVAAEIHFTEAHQFESFLAMLVAPFQHLPHWIFLTTYTPKEIREKAAMLARGSYSELSGGIVSAETDFVHQAVYAGLTPQDERDSNWTKTLANVGWLLRRMADKYAKADDFNSYKHGLRIISTSASLAMGIRPNSTDMRGAIVTTAPYSITHLKLTPCEGGTAVGIEPVSSALKKASSTSSGWPKSCGTSGASGSRRFARRNSRRSCCSPNWTETALRQSPS
jgi:hypothetical protein